MLIVDMLCLDLLTFQTQSLDQLLFGPLFQFCFVSIVSVLHWFHLSIYSLMLDFFITLSLSISQSVLYGDILCLMLVTILHWGIPPSLSSSDLLQIFSPLDLFLDLCESSYWGIPPLALFYQGIPPSLGLSHLMLISWLLDPFFDLYELSPRASLFPVILFRGIPLSCHLVQGHPPSVILFRASPYCQFVQGISLPFILIRALHLFFSLFGASPYCQFTQGIPLSSSCLGHPPTVNLSRAFPYLHLIQGVPLQLVCLGHPLIVSSPRAFLYRQFVQGVLLLLVHLGHSPTVTLFRAYPFLSVSPPQIFIYGHFKFTTIDFHLWPLISYHHHRLDIYGHFSLSPPQIIHLWAFVLVISPSQIFIYEHLFQFSPLQIKHLWAFQFCHHRFSSMGISVSPPQIFIHRL